MLESITAVLYFDGERLEVNPSFVDEDMFNSLDATCMSFEPTEQDLCEMMEIL